MNDFDAKRQQILDAFGIGNVASAAGNSSDPLRCYQVGDCDWFAATWGLGSSGTKNQRKA